MPRFARWRWMRGQIAKGPNFQRAKGWRGERKRPRGRCHDGAFGEVFDVVEFGVGEGAIGDEGAHGLGARGLWGRSGKVLWNSGVRKVRQRVVSWALAHCSMFDRASWRRGFRVGAVSGEWVAECEHTFGVRGLGGWFSGGAALRLPPAIFGQSFGLKAREAQVRAADSRGLVGRCGRFRVRARSCPTCRRPSCRRRQPRESDP